MARRFRHADVGKAWKDKTVIIQHRLIQIFLNPLREEFRWLILSLPRIKPGPFEFNKQEYKPNTNKHCPAEPRRHFGVRYSVPGTPVEGVSCATSNNRAHSCN
jgi:hypothetical protein